MQTLCLVHVRSPQLGKLYRVRRGRCSSLVELENCAVTLDTTVANDLLAKLTASHFGVLRRKLTKSNLLMMLIEAGLFRTIEANRIRLQIENSPNSNTLKSN